MFSIDIKKNELFPVIYLRNDEERTFAEIFSFGALLNSFKIENSLNIIDGFSSPQDAKDNITNGFKSAKLSPYVCRTTNGKYAFEGRKYNIGKFFLGKEAIHGLLYDANFDIIDSGANDDSAFVILKYQYTKIDEGFPFAYTCTVQYNLEKNNFISLKTTLENNSDSEMPVCDGWHPYFKLDAPVNELSFVMNADKMLEFNEQLVPTGKILSYEKFQKPEILGDIFLDNCFVLNANDKATCTLRSNKTGTELNIYADDSYPYLQVYTPEHRKSIAIENLSAAPDAFNNKMGLKVLQPGDSCSFKTSYKATMNL